MRDMMRWMRGSPDFTDGSEPGRTPGDAPGAGAPWKLQFREARAVRMAQLIRADRRKDEFIATLAHELRNPLGVLGNAAGLLEREQGMSPAGHRAQALIKRQIQRMTRLVDDLLDVSRISEGRLQLRRERLDLRVVVGHAVETVEPEIIERRQRLITALPPSPVWLQVDPWRLEQVFVNLLANASRYTDPAGEIAIFMHLRDDQVVVRFRDSGIGIAPDALPHVFEPFIQADPESARSRAGLGIGLALVRNLVTLHGGSVAAASAGLGRGSEFSVRLPWKSASGIDCVAGRP
jgi:signal transduction histidine kinase